MSSGYNRVSEGFNHLATGGIYATCYLFIVGGEKNVRQGDGDNVSNMKDDSPYAMGYSYLHNNFANTETVPMDNIPNSGDNMFELVPTPEPGLVNPTDGSYSSQGNRTEVDWGVPGQLIDDHEMKRGTIDTVYMDDGSSKIRNRDSLTGQILTYPGPKN